MRILYIAEIVSKAGLYCVKKKLPELRKEKNIDFVIANGDGVTSGYGIGRNHAVYLRKLGVDVITGGDQMFFKKDIVENFDHTGYLLRAANLPPDAPGRGWKHFSLDRPKEDPLARELPPIRIGVLSLIGQSGFHRMHGSNPFTFLTNISEKMRKQSNIIIVDFHALTTAEKQTMFFHADGQVTALIGSGQRVQTGDAQVLPNGTAVICDAGRTGSIDSVSGFDPKAEIRNFLTQVPERSQDGWARPQLQGVVLEIDEAAGWVLSIEAIQESCPVPQQAEKSA